MSEASMKLIFQLRRSSINSRIEFTLRFICGCINAVALYLHKTLMSLPRTATKTHLLMMRQLVMHLLPQGMLLLKLVDDARNRTSNVRLAKRAVDSTIATYALFASDAKGAKGFV
jgi:hypothetical protein